MIAHIFQHENICKQITCIDNFSIEASLNPKKFTRNPSLGVEAKYPRDLTPPTP